MVTTDHDAFDLPCLEVITIGEKCDSSAFLASTTCASNTVDVVFGVFRRIVVDDKRDSLHIKTTSRHISGTYDLGIPVAQIVQSLLSVTLFLVAMDRITSYVCAVETVLQLLAGFFRVAENHGPVVASPLF